MRLGSDGYFADYETRLATFEADAGYLDLLKEARDGGGSTLAPCEMLSIRPSAEFR